MSRRCECTSEEGHYIKQSISPYQIVGTWDRISNDEPPKAQIVLDEFRGSKYTYSYFNAGNWYLKPDGKVNIPLTASYDEGNFAITLDDDTLGDDTSDKLVRVSSIPKKKQPALKPEQLLGKWWMNDLSDPDYEENEVEITKDTMKFSDSEDKYELQIDGFI